MTTTPDRRMLTRWLAVGAAASAALAGVGLAGPAAQADPAPTPTECPAAVPVAELTAGQAVTGRTVTSGTTPEAFSGTVLGVLEDGITAGVDMVLVDLHSAAVDRAGIWSGMSGSPVYAADGRLVGAVAYSLGTGPSTVAGVTPATEMYRLLTPSRTTTAAPRNAAPLTTSLQRSVARAGAATGSTTMRRMRVPVGLSGLGAERVRSLAPALNSQGVHLADAPAGAPSGRQVPVTAGGNLAASMAYGTLTAAAVGTATAVCDGEVVGFGHPMNFTGASTLSMHGATATHIQDDSVFGGFKVANIGAPVGTVDRDRLAGIRGRAGALPTSYDVRTTATQGPDTRTARTHVTVGSLIPELAFGNTVAAQDRVLDRIGAGQATTRWTITGTRKDGSPFTYTRANRYADPGDISATTASALAMDLLALQDNPGEVVTITGVDARTTVEDAYETYRVAKVQYLRGTTWTTMARRGTALKQGRTVRLRVTLTSREAATRVVSTSITVPTRTAGRTGVLVVRGGGADLYSSEEFFDEEEEFFGEDGPAPSASTFPKLLTSLSTAPANDEVVASLQLDARGAAGRARTARADADRVVGGVRYFSVRATR